MIKLVHATWVADSKVALAFSDGTEGTYDFADLLARDTALTRPLRNEDAFKGFFLELGALCWPNGLEFSGASLHQDLKRQGKLRQGVATA
ncbi:MAG: DUF2442 domain-containing protein [Ramlibacter sp.]|nr:DUF2442 domain-containing protein [Ramlibacter sp.]